MRASLLRPALWALALTTMLGTGCKKDDDSDDGDPVLEPGDLLVGSARVRMPVPVGIGTVGNGGFDVQAEPSPFAEIYPATTRIHNHPDFRAVAVTRGEGFEVIFLRADTVGIFQQFRRAVVLELKERTGRDLDHALVIGATHTHSGPGRVIDAGGPFELIADRFHPEFYERMVDAMADAVEQALADAKPGRIAWARGRSNEAIKDRRCEDGGPDYVNGDLPILAVEQEGELKALVMSYAIHGTLLGIDELTLSQDVSGGIEQAVEDRFDSDVMVQMHNAWAADVAPGDPAVPTQVGAVVPGGYDRMESVGQAVADAVEVALTDLAWETEPEIRLETHRVPIDREHIGYDADVFEKYEYGGVYCGASYEADCDAATTNMDLDDQCIPFNELYPAPNQTEITVGQVGQQHLVTFPGEPGTVLAERIISELQTYSGVEQVMFIGYGQDYLGYSITEEDWWQGGYESSGALWGPRQGDYLAGEVVASFGETFGFVKEVDEPAPIGAFSGEGFVPYSGPSPADSGAVVVDVLPSYAGADAEVELIVGGDDPWWGAPIAWLETAGGAAVTRPNGTPVHSDGQAFWVDLAVDPPYEANETGVASRAFHWSFHLPLVHTVSGASPNLPPGDYRIRVELPNEDGTPTEVVSGTFTWEG